MVAGGEVEGIWGRGAGVLPGSRGMTWTVMESSENFIFLSTETFWVSGQ